ncbi:MAG: hypothetical protein KC983_00525, partial [Phycisphaerales bacterium]|nr:hypothetical protein [Phycisphaerales bacterium]
TREAFNALLKTMEEPPAHVKFILCTTEPHKVPATIQSRCQRFDFRTIAASSIAEHLRVILKEEKIKADDEVIFQIARLGNGSMRDALSVLDRLLAAGEKTLTSALLEQMLGLPSQKLVENLVQAIIDSDSAAALRSGAALLESGTTVELAMELLTERFRTMMVIAACGDDQELIDLSPEAREQAAAQAAHFDAAALVHMIALCDQVARNARNAASGRALFDATLVRLSLAEHLADIAALLRGAPVASASSSASASSGSKKKDRPEPSRGERGAMTATTVPSVPPSRATPSTPSAPSATPSPSSSSRAAVTEVKPAPASSSMHPWEAVEQAARKKPALQAKIEHVSCDGWDGKLLRLSLSADGASMVKWFRAHPNTLSDVVSDVMGRRIAVELSMPKDIATSVELTTAARAEALKDPVVQQAAELFDAALIDVQDEPAG